MNACLEEPGLMRAASAPPDVFSHRGTPIHPVALSIQLKNRAHPHLLHATAECLINLTEGFGGWQWADALEQYLLLPWGHLLQHRVPKPVAEHKRWNEKTSIHFEVVRDAAPDAHLQFRELLRARFQYSCVGFEARIVQERGVDPIRCSNDREALSLLRERERPIYCLQFASLQNPKRLEHLGLFCRDRYACSRHACWVNAGNQNMRHNFHPFFGDDLVVFKLSWHQRTNKRIQIGVGPNACPIFCRDPSHRGVGIRCRSNPDWRLAFRMFEGPFALLSLSSSWMLLHLYPSILSLWIIGCFSYLFSDRRLSVPCASLDSL